MGTFVPFRSLESRAVSHYWDDDDAYKLGCIRPTCLHWEFLKTNWGVEERGVRPN